MTTTEILGHVRLSEKFLKDLLTLKQALSKWQDGVDAYSTGPITIPLDAGPVVQDQARQLGIPITEMGICFIITSDLDMDRVMNQFIQLQSKLNSAADALAEKDNAISSGKRWWQFWK